jgi:hypothetical protein
MTSPKIHQSIWNHQFVSKERSPLFISFSLSQTDKMKKWKNERMKKSMSSLRSQNYLINNMNARSATLIVSFFHSFIFSLTPGTLPRHRLRWCHPFAKAKGKYQPQKTTDFNGGWSSNTIDKNCVHYSIYSAHSNHLLEHFSSAKTPINGYLSPTSEHLTSRQ